MTKQRLISAVMLILGFAGIAQAGIKPENLNRINFLNSTGETIEYVFVSPSDSSYWSTDILGSSTVFSDGDSRGFYIHYPDRCNDFDIMAIGASGSAFKMFGYEICDGAEAHVALTRKDLQSSAPDFDLVEIVIDNETAYDIEYLFFSPGDSNMWGIDQLDSGTILRPGQSVSLLLPASDSPVRYDVQAVDEDADSYSFYVSVDNSSSRATFAVEPSDLD